MSGPKNLPKRSPVARTRKPAVRASKAKMPRSSPSKAIPHRAPSTGAGSHRQQTPMASQTGQEKINKPRTPGGKGRIPLNPRADMKSKI